MLRFIRIRFLTCLLVVGGCVAFAAQPPAGMTAPAGMTVGPDGTMVTYRVSHPSQRLEMMVNSSRLLTLEKPVPRLQVHNPKILRAMPVGPDQIQVSAQAPGVTQLNLWDNDNNLYTVDVVITGDSRELEAVLSAQFPSAALRVTVLPTGAIIDGTVTDGDDVERVIAVSEQYYPNVVNNIHVAGVQSVLLQTKVLEVSRTKLRTLGIDLGYLSNGNFSAVTGVSNLLSPAASGLTGNNIASSASGSTVRVGGIFGSNTVDTLVRALRENELVKVVAEPTVIAIHGRPAKFTAGGRFPIVIPAGNNQVTVQFVEFGTVVNFVAFVLGENRVRLEVRPEISELDPTRGVTLNGTVIPGIRQRYVETGVEMEAGQTLALAGLIQSRTESVNSGLPFFSDLPYVGALFRRVQDKVNDIEVVFLITPEFATALEPHQVPPGGPGLNTVSPNDCELYGKGYLEVPLTGCRAGCAEMPFGVMGAEAIINEHVAMPSHQPYQPPPMNGPSGM